MINKQHMARAIGAQPKAKPMLLPEQLDELRDFLEELDVIPLSALPSEVWPLVYDHLQAITADDFEPKAIDKPFYDNLNQALRLRKKLRIAKNQSELLPFNF